MRPSSRTASVGHYGTESLIARPAIDPDENVQRWVNWHAALASRRANNENVNTNISTASAPPLVTVCLNYCDRPNCFSKVLESLRRQSWPTLEMILLDCSTAGMDDTVRN